MSKDFLYGPVLIRDVESGRVVNSVGDNPSESVVDHSIALVKEYRGW